MVFLRLASAGRDASPAHPRQRVASRSLRPPLASWFSFGSLRPGATRRRRIRASASRRAPSGLRSPHGG